MSHSAQLLNDDTARTEERCNKIHLVWRVCGQTRPVEGVNPASSPATALQRLRLDSVLIHRLQDDHLCFVSSRKQKFHIEQRKCSNCLVYAPQRCSRVCVKSRSGCCSQAASRAPPFWTTCTVETRDIASRTQRRSIRTVRIPQE